MTPAQPAPEAQTPSAGSGAEELQLLIQRLRGEQWPADVEDMTEYAGLLNEVAADALDSLVALWNRRTPPAGSGEREGLAQALYVSDYGPPGESNLCDWGRASDFVRSGYYRRADAILAAGYRAAPQAEGPLQPFGDDCELCEGSGEIKAATARAEHDLVPCPNCVSGELRTMLADTPRPPVQEQPATPQGDAEGLRAALELAEDVLSRSPFSTRIWPNGMHPNTGIEIIREALSAPPARVEDSDADGYVKKSAVVLMLHDVASRMADEALFGEPENSRAREAAEAALTRASYAVAFMPSARVEGESAGLRDSVAHLRAKANVEIEGAASVDCVVRKRALRDLLYAYAALSAPPARVEDAEHLMVRRLTEERNQALAARVEGESAGMREAYVAARHALNRIYLRHCRDPYKAAEQALNDLDADFPVALCAPAAKPEGARAGLRERYIVDEEGGSPVGIVIDLPDGSQVWTGDLADRTFALDVDATEEFEFNEGAFLVHANKDTHRILARVVNAESGIKLAQAYAQAAIRAPAAKPEGNS